MEKGATMISIQKDALVNHALNNVYGKTQIKDIILLENGQITIVPKYI